MPAQLADQTRDLLRRSTPGPPHWLPDTAPGPAAPRPRPSRAVVQHMVDQDGRSLWTVTDISVMTGAPLRTFATRQDAERYAAELERR